MLDVHLHPRLRPFSNDLENGGWFVYLLLFFSPIQLYLSDNEEIIEGDVDFSVPTGATSTKSSTRRRQEWETRLGRLSNERPARPCPDVRRSDYKVISFYGNTGVLPSCYIVRGTRSFVELRSLVTLMQRCAHASCPPLFARQRLPIGHYLVDAEASNRFSLKRLPHEAIDTRNHAIGPTTSKPPRDDPPSARLSSV
ncbi:hypothetical protein EVAR_64619_1 [Eumeta japonica]|uniref:Uncharacterized protein n=1 Tax=Eumeta variegata TaxID=151549 RepID=A0A4C1ZCC2_EUMVA|nr:hypothetical protein EVAR_64619_1 [Eumeta japonica]